MGLRIPTFSEMLAVARSRGADGEAPGLWNGLVGAWPMAAGGGTTAFDLSGHGHHGTLTNMVPADDWVVTEKGWALDFSDIGHQHVDLGTSIALMPTKAITLSAWIRPSGSLGNKSAILSIPGRDFRTPGSMLFSSITRFVRFYIHDGGWQYVQSDNVISSLAWTHVLGRWDGATLRLWIDGYLQAGSNTATLIDYGDADTSGKINSYDDVSFNARVALPSIHSRALAPSEIQQLYADPYAMYTPRQRVFAAAVAPPSGKLFRQSGSLNGLGGGGPFFNDPLAV